MRKNQTGFSIVETVVVLVIVAAVAVAGYTIYHKNHKTTTAAVATGSTAKTASVPSAPAITTSSDLTKAEQVLDQNDPSTTNSADLSQFDSQTSSF